PINVIKNQGLKGVKLLIVGDGQLRAEVEQAVEGSNDVVFLGYKSNVQDYLALSDAYISASFSEGLPNAVLEAMSHNLIPILSNIPQHKEVNSDKKYDQLYFSPSKEQELLESIEYAKGLFEKKNYNFRSNVLEGFTDKIMSQKYQDLYLKLYGKI
ncbi:MAG: glycosyltransferase family 4 protein, partial [Nitrososphaeraceae archaeon]|nr:glycosyltransferase family 4 protein [Nitrososphaeraceae archaeon]